MRAWAGDEAQYTQRVDSIDIAEDRVFWGLDAYQKAIAAGVGKVRPPSGAGSPSASAICARPPNAAQS